MTTPLSWCPRPRRRAEVSSGHRRFRPTTGGRIPSSGRDASCTRKPSILHFPDAGLTASHIMTFMADSHARELPDLTAGIPLSRFEQDPAIEGTVGDAEV